jgi:hypothetical protein
MGTKQTKQSLDSSSIINNNENSNTLLRVKRQRKSTNSNNQLNRTSTSPVLINTTNNKWRVSSLFTDLTNDEQQQQQNQQQLITTSSKSSMSVSTQPSPNSSTVNHKPLTVDKKNASLDLNKQMNLNQQRLTNIIKQADTNQPSYQMNSKLYRPNSFLLANTNPLNSNRVLQTKQQQQQQPQNTLPRTNHVKINTTHQLPLMQNNDKIPVTSKIAKKLGLSPRFKRKIVETIANKVQSSHNLNNNNSASNNNLNHKSTVIIRN